MTARRSQAARGFTLLEVMVAVAILAMVSVLIYGAFDGLSRGKKSLGRVNDRYHQGRAAIARIAMELSSAFLSTHQPLTEQQIRRLTIFSGTRRHRPPTASTSPRSRTGGWCETRTRAIRTRFVLRLARSQRVRQDRSRAARVAGHRSRAQARRRGQRAGRGHRLVRREIPRRHDRDCGPKRGTPRRRPGSSAASPSR